MLLIVMIEVVAFKVVSLVAFVAPRSLGGTRWSTGGDFRMLFTIPIFLTSVTVTTVSKFLSLELLL